MNIAIIFAGGTGQRMNTTSRPKQFLEVHGKPIIIYTLERFERHPQIDGIVLVCLESWIAYAKQLVKRFQITKLRAVIPGGRTGQESIFNGVKKAYELYSKDDIVLVHDGVRPLIDEDTISQCIISVKEHGNAITVAPAIETVFVKSRGNQCVGTILNRDKCELAKAPQCFYLKDIYTAHRKALNEGKIDCIDSASLMQYYGYSLFTVEGSAENIKITTPTDYYIFRALLDAHENLQIMGV